MQGRRPTWRELLEAVDGLTAQNARLQEQMARQQEQIETLLKEVKHYRKIVPYYQNPNTPPSAESIEWRMKKRQEAEGRENDPGAQGKRPGGEQGHKGNSREHAPTRREHHKFGRKRIRGKDITILPKCSCGGHTVQGPARTRDIIEMEVKVEETRHRIDTAKCMQCSRIIEAPHDLPRNGSYGKHIVGLVTVLRGARIPFKEISEVIKELTGTKIATSTVLYAYARAADAMRSDARKNKEKIAKAKCAGFDETIHKDNGRKYWVTVARSGNRSYFYFSNSRATRLLDEMDYKGIAITDMCAAYKRFDEWGMHQYCWAHVLRYAKHLFEKLDPTLSDAWRSRRRVYWEALMWLFRLGKLVAASGAHSQAWRERLESMLAKVLDRYDTTDDAGLEKHVRMMERHLHGMFTFVEHPGAEPTNNASERSLRYYVVFRRVFGHTRGGDRAMRRLGDFISCRVTWRNEGKSIMAEVARLI